MPNYAIHDSSGKILRTISCPEFEIEFQLSDDESYLECNAAPHDSIDMETKTVIAGAPVEMVKKPAYVSQREALYPSVQEQLDMLWHAMDSGVLNKVDAFYNAIKLVKEAVPKSVDLSLDSDKSVEL